PRLGLVRQSLLLSPFGGLDLRDLNLDAREKLLALGELAADLVALGRTFRDEALLLGAGYRQLGLALLDLRPEGAHLVDDTRVLIRHAVARVDPVTADG